MKKQIIYIIIGAVILLGVSTFIAVKYNPDIFTVKQKPAPAKTDNQIILYYKAALESAKVAYESKEVFQNQTYAAELGQKAAICKISANAIGVPFLWDGPDSKCIVGDQDVINFFKSKIGQ